jgi:hypothetical protein
MRVLGGHEERGVGEPPMAHLEWELPHAEPRRLAVVLTVMGTLLWLTWGWFLLFHPGPPVRLASSAGARLILAAAVLVWAFAVLRPKGIHWRHRIAAFALGVLASALWVPAILSWWILFVLGSVLLSIGAFLVPPATYPLVLWAAVVFSWKLNRRAATMLRAAQQSDGADGASRHSCE